jgi:hypothetical protein
MTQTVDNVWISSIPHLNLFNSISPPGSWLKTLLNLNKIPSDYPQVKKGVRSFPIVFFSKGSLQIFERQIEFHAYFFDSKDQKEYSNLKGDYRFELEYKSIQIESYFYPKPFMRAFNIPWIRISSKNNSFVDILMSMGGPRMKQIKEANEGLLEVLRNKIEIKNHD